MNDLVAMLDALIEREELPWKRRGRSVVLELWRSGRKHRVWLRKSGDMYVFRSVVAKAEFVTRSDERWRNLAYRAWRKNSLKEFVTFAFDEHHRLIGLIEQPVATLDHEELRFYIETLARECDRFEYILTGEDSL